MTLETLGYRIKQKREKLGFTQEDLANRLKINRQSISKWERNETQPELTTLVELSVLLNSSTDWLLGVNHKTFATKLNIFRNLSPNEINLILNYFQVHTFPEGEYIFEEGQKSPADFYLLENGEVQITRLGKEWVPSKTGGYFSDVSFLDGRGCYLTAIAIKSAKVYVLEKPKFIEFKFDYPQLALSVYDNFLLDVYQDFRKD